MRGKSVGSVSCDCVLRTTGAIVSTTKAERFKLSIFQEVTSSLQISQQHYGKTMPTLQTKSRISLILLFPVAWGEL